MITFFHLSTCRKYSCVQYFPVRNSPSEPYTGSSMIEWQVNQVAAVPEEGYTWQEGCLGIVWHLGSLTCLEVRVGVMTRNENELVSRNQVTEHAVSHQKESELPSDRDGVPTEGLFQWGSVTLSFLERETLAVACKMDGRGRRQAEENS